MENIWKEHSVVMLATKDKASVWLPPLGSQLFTNSKSYRMPNGTYQYLYFTSDEEIKEGDWYIYENTLGMASDRHEGSMKFKKIIATTNLNIISTVSNLDESARFMIWQKNIGVIPQSFIEFYIKNSVNKVGLEYEEYSYNGYKTPHYLLKLVNNEVVVRAQNLPHQTRTDVGIEMCYGKTIHTARLEKPTKASNWRELMTFRMENEKWLNVASKIATEIYFRLKELNKSKVWLENKLRVSPQTIDSIMKGNENLTLKTISEIEEILNTKLNL